MACRTDSAAPLTPPLSAAANDYEKSFSFDLAHDGAETSRAALRYERKMGDTELSYFLPSRQTGVNDMCVLVFMSSRRCALTLAVGICTSASTRRAVLRNAPVSALCGPSCVCATLSSARVPRCTIMTTYDLCKVRFLRACGT